MKLIIGLGNPGKEYEKTRHNVGFMALDLIQTEFGFEEFHEEKSFKGQVSIGNFGGNKVILLKPMTFMNLSGEAVLKVVQFYKIKPEDCLAIVDDLDLPLGSLRIRKKGGPGSHNGMKSLVQVLGEDFPRLRIGIESRGVSASVQQETVSFVLDSFRLEEKKQLEDALLRSFKAVKMILEQDLGQAMNFYNVSA